MFKKYLGILSIFILYSYSVAQQVVTPPQPSAQAAGGPWTTGEMDPATTPIDDYSIYLIGIALMVGVGYFIINKYKKSLI